MHIYINVAFVGLKSNGCTVGGDPVAGSGLRAAKPRDYCEGSGLPPRPGSLPGPPESGRAVRNSSSEWAKKLTWHMVNCESLNTTLSFNVIRRCGTWPSCPQTSPS